MTRFGDSDVLGSYTPPKKTIVMCHGVWDLLHVGHVRHLQEAAKLGDWLVVSVTPDRHVNKGMGRPHFTASQRVEMLRALDCVDEVIVGEEDGPWDLMRKLKPAFYVKGVDYVGQNTAGIAMDRAVAAEVGAEMRFTGTRKWSSSQLLNFEKFSGDVCEYLATLKKLDAKEKILEAFSRADEKNVVFVGETIIDTYRYVQGLGKASKEFMLATVEVGYETFEGGIVAASKHGEWVQKAVLTASPAIIKTRYVDKDFNRKLFDVYSHRELHILPEHREVFRNALADAVVDSDVLVINDFGHGLFGEIERDIIGNAAFLAVNCQSNAGNYGFNLVTKYKQASYICIDDPEARLAAGIQRGPINEVIRAISHEVKCPRYLITHGKQGSHSFAVQSSKTSYGSAHSSHPALADGGIDTMGAGDAVMAVTAPLVAVGLEMSLAAFVGNVVGAIKVSILGHRRHVGRDEIIQTVEALLA